MDLNKWTDKIKCKKKNRGIEKFQEATCVSGRVLNGRGKEINEDIRSVKKCPWADSNCPF
jgi:hypothetical protein